MKYAIFILTVLVLFSCKKHQKDHRIYPLSPNNMGQVQVLDIKEGVSSQQLITDEAEIISVPESPEPVQINDYIEEYKYVHLETNAACLIGNIHKIYTDSSYIFVFDKQNNKALIFSDTGNFYTKLGKKGRGPREYIELCNISLDTYKKEVCLLDLGGLKLLFYSYSGEYLREEPMFYYYSGIEFMGQNRMALSTSFAYNDQTPAISNHRVIVAQCDQTPLYKGFPYTSKLREDFHWEDAQPIKKIKDDIFFHHVLSDTIWQIKDSLCKARYVVKFPERNNLFNEHEMQTITDKTYSDKTAKNIFFNGIYLMNDQFISMAIVNQDQIAYPLIYSRKTGKILYGLFFAKWDMNELGPLLIHSYFDFTYKDNAFVKVIQPFEALSMLKDMRKNKTDMTKYPFKDQEFMKKLHEEDNPVLMIVKLKEF